MARCLLTTGFLIARCLKDYRVPDFVRIEKVAKREFDSALGNQRAKVDVGRKYGNKCRKVGQ
jgi:hypothetical protein